MTDASDDLDNATLVTVAERPSEAAASIVLAALGDAGIRAVATGGFTAEFRAEAPGMVRIQTLQRDAVLARQVIAEIRTEPPEDWTESAADE